MYKVKMYIQGFTFCDFNYKLAFTSSCNLEGKSFSLLKRIIQNSHYFRHKLKTSGLCSPLHRNVTGK